MRVVARRAYFSITRGDVSLCRSQKRLPEGFSSVICLEKPERSLSLLC